VGGRSSRREAAAAITVFSFGTLEHDQEKHVPAKAGMDTGFPEKSCENKRI